MGIDTILVVVDRLSEYAHFIGLSHPFSAPTVTNTFLRETVRYMGILPLLFQTVTVIS